MNEFDYMLIEMTVWGFIDGFLFATLIFLLCIRAHLKKKNRMRGDRHPYDKGATATISRHKKRASPDRAEAPTAGKTPKK